MVRSGNKIRRGAAIIEVALALPLLVLVALSTVDTCSVIFLRQSAKIAAYECARVAIIPGVRQEDIQLQCDAIMAHRHIQDYTLNLSVEDLTSLSRGDLLQVSVSIPANTNSLVTSWFYRDRVFDETVTILAER
ncbi:MAG: pilus assembly protein [Planctomycetales bacterium]|nr:pilus assembly protein [Planctomycetales bacterium]